MNFGPNSPAKLVSFSDSQIVAINPPSHIPAGGSGVVDVAVTTTVGGTSGTSAQDQFDYGPILAAISPAFGPPAGGTTVTISGTNLAQVTSVRFGGTPATSFSMDSDSQVTAVSPPGTGIVQVTLIGPGGVSAKGAAAQFSYAPVVSGTAPAGAGVVDVTAIGTGGTSGKRRFGCAPEVRSVSPDYGPGGGGTTVVITGDNFTGVTAVSFGPNPAAKVTVDSDTQITADIPSLPPGTYDVTVALTDGTTSPTGPGDQFTAATTVPAGVNAIGPSSGQAGTAVFIVGTGFTGAQAVSFGPVPATSFVVANDCTVLGGGGRLVRTPKLAACSVTVIAIPLLLAGAAAAAAPVTTAAAVARTGSTGPASSFTISGSLSGVAAISAGAWAVGSASGRTLIVHRNGKAWKRVPSPSPGGGGFLDSVTATSARNAWAVGGTGRGKTLILRWNGKAWK